MTATDPFSQAFGRGVTEAVGPPPTRARALPAAPFTLHGSVLTGAGSLADAYVTVANGLIDDISTAEPSSTRVLRTEGVILPGLLDLHGHPEFNVFAPWEPPRQYANRYRWRASDEYHALVRDPQNVLLSTVPPLTQLRYAEVRALVAGVTGIQGASGASTATVEPLVRNVDLWAFGEHRARSMIDLPAESSRDFPRLQKVLGLVATGEVTAFYLHLCEGRRGDERSRSEFERFVDLKVATPATVVIHGTALDADQLHQLADAGSRLVWSPQSNLRLYGETTLASVALEAGIDVALGADWLPSGSLSLLHEMKVARRELARQGRPVSPPDLVAMVTSVAARVAGLDAHLGTLAPGRVADLVVLERHHLDPYENVCLADPAWVELVSIGGDVTYARADWFEALTDGSAGGTVEDLTAWGKPMRIDTGFQQSAGAEAPAEAPSLSAIRRLLTAAYPPVGPIFA